MTENDVTRALKYWEAEGLLRLTFDRDGTIAGICLNAVTSISSQKDTPTAPPEQCRPAPAQSAVAAQTGTGITGTPVGTTPAVSMHPRSTQELHLFSESDDGTQLIFIIQQYLGRPLSASDLNTIYYFYDDLGFSRDLIEYLFELLCLQWAYPYALYRESGFILGRSPYHHCR